MGINRKVVLARRIEGVPVADDFRVIETELPVAAEGQLLIRHVYLSLDPYQRSAIAGVHMSADRALATDEAPAGETVGRVVESQHPDFKVDDYVRSKGGWQEYSVAEGSAAVKLDPAIAPLATHLGILGMPGLTAYASVVKLAEFQPGQRLLVSAATGPVGSMVGQLARMLGGTAFGVAGSAEKCAYAVDELGFAACVNYKEPDYPESLAAAIPDGVDMYHDNVGGQMLVDALGVLRNYGTVVLCGLISQYNTQEKGKGFNLGPAILKRAVMKGLIVYDFEDQRDEFLNLAAPWVRDGSIRYKEDRASGIEHTGAHFAKLMSGDNFGKTLVVLEEGHD